MASATLRVQAIAEREQRMAFKPAIGVLIASVAAIAIAGAVKHRMLVKAETSEARPWGALAASAAGMVDARASELRATSPADLARHLQLAPEATGAMTSAAGTGGSNTVADLLAPPTVLPPEPGAADGPAAEAREPAPIVPKPADEQAVAVLFHQAIGSNRPAGSGVTAYADDPTPAGQRGLRADSGGIDINTASLAALNGLPGVGHVGRAIVRHRPYRSVAELLSRRVLRTSDFERVKSKVRVD